MCFVFIDFFFPHLTRLRFSFSLCLHEPDNEWVRWDTHNVRKIFIHNIPCSSFNYIQLYNALSLPFFPHFEIFPVNTKLYAVCVLLQNIKFLYSNSLGLVLSHSEYSYSSSFCLESFSLVLSPALALARLIFDKENVICGSVVVMAELCAILCFIKLFHSPQDIEHNLTTEYKKKRTQLANEEKTFSFLIFRLDRFMCMLYRRLFISYVNIFDILSLRCSGSTFFGVLWWIERHTHTHIQSLTGMIKGRVWDRVDYRVHALRKFLSRSFFGSLLIFSQHVENSKTRPTTQVCS